MNNSDFVVDGSIVISDDIGTRHIKIVWNGGSEILDSACAPLSERYSDGSPDPYSVIRINNEKESWVFGKNIQRFGDTGRIQLYNDESRYYSTWYLRCVLYSTYLAFARQGLAAGIYAPRIILSIPAQLYANKDAVVRVRKGLEGDHTVYAGDQQYVFRFRSGKDGNVIIRPEGAGAFAAALIAEANDEAPVTKFATSTVAVAAWGWFTLSVIGFRSADPIRDLGRSNSVVGMDQIAQRLLPLVGSPMNLPMTEVNNVLFADDPVEIGGRQYNITSRRNTVATNIADEGMSFLASVLKNTNLNFSDLVLLGGTAEYLFGPMLDSDTALVKIKNLRSRSSLPGRIWLAHHAPIADAEGHFADWSSRGI